MKAELKVKDLLRALDWHMAKDKGYAYSRISERYEHKHRIARTVFRNLNSKVYAYFLGTSSSRGAFDDGICIFKSKQRYYGFSFSKITYGEATSKIMVRSETLCSAMADIKKQSERCYNSKYKCERNMARGKIKAELLKQISIEAI